MQSGRKKELRRYAHSSALRREPNLGGQQLLPLLGLRFSDTRNVNRDAFALRDLSHRPQRSFSAQRLADLGSSASLHVVLVITVGESDDERFRGHTFGNLPVLQSKTSVTPPVTLASRASATHARR